MRNLTDSIIEGLVFSYFGAGLFYPIIDTLGFGSYYYLFLELFAGYLLYKLILKRR